MPAATSAPLRPEPVKEKKQSAAATGGAPKLNRPDQTAYKSEQDALDKEIGVVREELVSANATRRHRAGLEPHTLIRQEF